MIEDDEKTTRRRGSAKINDDEIDDDEKTDDKEGICSSHKRNLKMYTFSLMVATYFVICYY